MKKPTIILLTHLTALLVITGIWVQRTEAFGIGNKKEEILLETYPTKKWVADVSHSSLRFNTSHFVVSDLVGRFNEFEIVMYSDEKDFTDAVIEGKIKIASANMPNPGMAKKIQSPDYFDVGTYPEAIFKSTSIKKTGDDTYEITGDLSIKGISKSITLYAEFGGYIRNEGACGFKVRGSMNRKDFGVGKGGPKDFEGIGPVIGFDVDFDLNLLLKLQ